MSLIQPLLALAFRVGANQVRSYCFPTSFSRGDLRLCLIDASKRSCYTRILQLALATVVFDGGTGCFNCCSGLVNLCPVIVVLQFDDEVALMYSLKVGYMNRAHDAGHLGAQRCKVPADVSIISYLFDLAALPRIPVASDSDQNRQAERHDEERSYVLFPSGTAVRRGRRFVALRRQRFRHGGGRFSRYWRGGHQICSFSSKESANAALFVTELLRPLCLSKLIHAEAIGSVCFWISDITLLNEKIQSWLWARGSCDVSCTSIIVLMRRSS